MRTVARFTVRHIQYTKPISFLRSNLIPDLNYSSKFLLRYRSNWHILQNRIISFIVLSSDNTNCKNDIQLFHQLFDELSVHTDYH